MLPDISRYEYFVDLSNGRLRYYEAGSGDAHTILLHGGGGTASADSFQFVLAPLAEHLHVYALD
ncbi:MAG: alpha/beta hydrolase, partial [Planctomycetes bacterium]|nr:alpha/beta hydrolase [Planctomycetota bacterium]